MPRNSPQQPGPVSESNPAQSSSRRLPRILISVLLFFILVITGTGASGVFAFAVCNQNCDQPFGEQPLPPSATDQPTMPEPAKDIAPKDK